MSKEKDFITLFSKYVYQFDKIKYFLNRNESINNCILCNLENKEDSLLICNSSLINVCVNLYPYNSGHIMLYPKRHVEKFLDLNDNENLHLFYFTKFFIEALIDIYNPSGFNVGMNLGENSGASIKHIHQHIIPRYKNELGMIDIIGGSKVIVESPIITKKKLLDYVSKNYKKLSFEIFLKN